MDKGKGKVKVKDKGRREHVGFINDSGKFIVKGLNNIDRKEDSSQLKNDLFSNMYGTHNVYIPAYNPSELVGFLEVNSYHNKCVSAKADDGSGDSWKVSIIGDETEVSLFNKRFVEEILNNVDINDEYGQVIFDEESISYGCLEVCRNNRLPGGSIDSIFHVPSLEVRVHRSENKFVQSKYGEVVWFKSFGYGMDVNKHTGFEFDLGTLPYEDRANEMIMYKKYSPTDLVYGMSDVIPLLNTLTADAYRLSSTLNSFKNGFMASWAVIITGDVDQIYTDDESGIDYNIQTEIQDLFSQVAESQSSVMVYVLPTNLDGGKIEVTFEKLGDEQKEVSYNEFRLANVDEILSGHGVPSQRIGLSKEGALAGGNTQEVFTIYNSKVVQPKIRRIEDFVNDYWIPSLGVTDILFEIISEDLVVDDNKLKVLGDLFNRGVITPNQLINIYGEEYGLELSDKEQMDGHYINGMRIDVEWSSESEVEYTKESKVNSLYTVLMNKLLGLN